MPEFELSRYSPSDMRRCQMDHHFEVTTDLFQMRCPLGLDPWPCS
jgi:hypothetical protein